MIFSARRYKYAESVANEQTSSCNNQTDDCNQTYGLEHVIAAVLYLSELDEITLQETKDYKRTHFMSDIGGGAGLILGIRYASLAFPGLLPVYFRFTSGSLSVHFR